MSSSRYVRTPAAAALALAALLLSPDALGAPPRPAASQSKSKPRAAKPPAPPPPVLEVPDATRLLVIAPHPDDEVLGAGGLMQRVKASGGTVRVVYLTDGDGYPEGVKEEDHVETPTAEGLSRLRQAAPARSARGARAARPRPTRSRPFSAFPTAGCAG